MGSLDSVAENSQLHIVAIPFPSQGHITPLLQLCRVLASKGSAITFINTEGNHGKMRNVLEDNEKLGIRFETVPDGLPVAFGHFDLFHQDNRSLMLKATDDMKETVEKLLKEKVCKRKPPISFLLTDVFLTWSREVAGGLGVQRVVFWTSTCSDLLLDFHIPQLLENGHIPVEDPSRDDLVDYIPGLSPLPIWALPCYFSSESESFDPGFQRKVHRMESIGRDSWVLINSFQELETQAFLALKVFNPKSIPVGPLLLHSECSGKAPSLWEENKECLIWLDKQDPEAVLYISFGSVAVLSIEQLDEIATGLEAIGQPFLWGVRPNLVSGGKSQALEVLKDRFSGSPLGLIVSWAPQLEVLSHPSIGGFLTHCGWNSILESISKGVPMLCWPCVAEQNLNCKLVVEDWKMGVKFPSALQKKFVTKQELGETVKKLMDKSAGRIEMCKNARSLQEAAHRTVTNGGSSHVNLQRFSQSWSAAKSSCNSRDATLP